MFQTVSVYPKKGAAFQAHGPAHSFGRLHMSPTSELCTLVQCITSGSSLACSAWPSASLNPSFSAEGQAS